MQEIVSLTGLINGIFAISFGSIVLFKNYRERLNQLFFLLTLAVALWSFSYWQWLQQGSYGPALMWVRLLSIGSLFIPIFFFHWVSTLLNWQGFTSAVKLAAYSFSIVCLTFITSPIFIKDLRPSLSFAFWPLAGPLYSAYLILVYTGLVGLSLALLVIRRGAGAPEQRQQINYVLLGALFGFAGGATNFFLWYEIPVPPWGTSL